MVERRLQRIGAELAHLRTDAVELRRHHVDLGELLPCQIVRNQHIAVRRRRGRVLQQRALPGVAQTQKLANAFDDVTDLRLPGLLVAREAGDLGTQGDIEIALRTGQFAPVPVVDRTAVRRRRFKLDANFARLGFELLLAEKLQLGEPRGKAQEHHAAAAEKDHPARREEIFPVSAHLLRLIVWPP